jgi:FkbM family methyltransferase
MPFGVACLYVMSGSGGSSDVFRVPRQHGLETWCHDTALRFRQRGGFKLASGALWAAWLIAHMSQNPTLGKRLPVAVSRQTFWQIWRRTIRRSIVVQMAAGYRIVLPPWSHMAGITLATGLHEPREQLFALAYLRAGDTAIDVGANIGIYSTMMASTGAEVIAFEPGSRSRSDLAQSVALNPGLTITVVPVALSNSAGEMSLTLDLESSNHLVEASTGKGTERVKVMKLDNYLAGEPPKVVAFVKVDAEGFDLQVLQGAEHLFASQKPSLMIETWGPPTVRNWLEERGYRIYRYAFESRTLHEYPRPFTTQANILAVHDDMIGQVQNRLLSAAPPSFALPKVEWTRQG